jgi:hypothetical protein
MDSGPAAKMTHEPDEVVRPLAIPRPVLLTDLYRLLGLSAMGSLRVPPTKTAAHCHICVIDPQLSATVAFLLGALP